MDVLFGATDIQVISLRSMQKRLLRDKKYKKKKLTKKNNIQNIGREVTSD